MEERKGKRKEENTGKKGETKRMKRKKKKKYRGKKGEGQRVERDVRGCQGCVCVRVYAGWWRLEKKSRERAYASCASCHDTSARAKGLPLWLWRAIKSAFSAQQTFRGIRSTVGKRLPEWPPTVHRPEVFSPVKNFQTRRSTWRTPVARLYRLHGARACTLHLCLRSPTGKRVVGNPDVGRRHVEKGRGCSRGRNETKRESQRERERVRERVETRRRRDWQQRKRWKERRRGGRGGGGG